MYRGGFEYGSDLTDIILIDLAPAYFLVVVVLVVVVVI